MEKNRGLKVLAEGEELGSNLLHVGRRTGTNQVGHSSLGVVACTDGHLWAKFAPSDRAATSQVGPWPTTLSRHQYPTPVFGMSIGDPKHGLSDDIRRGL
jgi:hypothetical protein